jgi:hypothetical protein
MLFRVTPGGGRANRTAVSFLPNTMGMPAFPTVAQGTLGGYPIVTSANMPNNIVLLVDADMLLHASDDTIRLDVSREASVQADDAPNTPASGMVSLWQQNLIGILAEKYEWWGRARDQAIVVINTVTWATAPAPLAAPLSATAAAAPRTAPPGAPRRT